MREDGFELAWKFKEKFDILGNPRFYTFVLNKQDIIC